MPNYSRPKSSVPQRGPRSSLNPNGAPGFTETLAGLKKGLLNLGSHLAGAGAGMVGNLISPLTNLKKSAQEGDEESERAYQEALEMLRGSGSSSADSLLSQLGEQLDEEPEGNEAPVPELHESEKMESDGAELIQEQTQVAADGSAEVQHERAPETPAQPDKVICMECGEEFKRLTHSHLSTHGMSPMEYRKKYEVKTSTPIPAKSSTRGKTGAANKKRTA